MPAYLDCNATTPVEADVAAIVMQYTMEEYGNAGSRSHGFGARAKVAVERAREQVAAVVKAQREEVIFTSGATESNNLAILGLLRHGEESGRRHIVSTQIEHKAVLEPLEYLVRRHGFETTLVPPTSGGWVDPAAVRGALRRDTLLVSVMHVNNETGVAQPIGELARCLADHHAFFHVDAAQGFGKVLPDLQDPRVDLISASAHKIYGPKGVGCLVARRRGYARPPLEPRQLGGGQERGLRAGTVPVPLVVGFGLAAQLAIQHHKARAESCEAIREAATRAFGAAGAIYNGDPARRLPHVLNLSIPGGDSEALILALKDLAAVSNGAACTSSDYSLSHVLQAMGCPRDVQEGALRFSWSHLTPPPDWGSIVAAIQSISRPTSVAPKNPAGT